MFILKNINNDVTTSVIIGYYYITHQGGNLLINT